MCTSPTDTSATLRGAVGDIELVITLGARKEGVDSAGNAGGGGGGLLRSASISIKSSVSFRRSSTAGSGGGGGDLMRSPSLSLRSPSLFGRGSSKSISSGSGKGWNMGSSKSLREKSGGVGAGGAPPLRSVESVGDAVDDADAPPAPLPPPSPAPPVVDGIEEASQKLKSLGGRLSDEELLANQKMRGSL